MSPHEAVRPIPEELGPLVAQATLNLALAGQLIPRATISALSRKAQITEEYDRWLEVHRGPR